MAYRTSSYGGFGGGGFGGFSLTPWVKRLLIANTAIFLVAFYLPRVGARAVFWAAILSEGAVLYCKFYTDMAWLWWNVVGCVAGVVAALIIQVIVKQEPLKAEEAEA